MQNRGYDVINGVNHTNFEGWNIVKVDQILRFMAGFDLMEVILQIKYNFLLYNAVFCYLMKSLLKMTSYVNLSKALGFPFDTGDIAIITEKLWI